jgi:phosphoglycolate phosphatase
MARRYSLLVFDWDGTLMDSAGAIVASLQAACSDLGLPVPDEERARHIIGLGLHDAMAYLLPFLDPAEYPRVVARYREHFIARDPDTVLFAGAAELLRELDAAGHYLAVATGKSRRGLERALDHSGLRGVFHATRCGDEETPKPDPAMLNHLRAVFDVAASATLMVGDTTHDLQMAANAGVPVVAAAYGAHPRTALDALAPLACCETPAELWEWLRANA